MSVKTTNKHTRSGNEPAEQVCPFSSGQHHKRVGEIEAYDPLEPSTRVDPWPYYQWFHRQMDKPVYKLGMEQNFYVVSRYNDIRTIFMDHEHFTNKLWRDKDTALFMLKDGEDHLRIREILNQIFLPAKLQVYQPMVDQIVAQHTEALMAKDGPRELMSAWARKIPIHVFAALMGMDTAPAALQRFGDQIIAVDKATFPVGGTGPRHYKDSRPEAFMKTLMNLVGQSTTLRKISSLIGWSNFLELYQSIPFFHTNSQDPRYDYDAFPDAATQINDLVLSIAEVYQKGKDQQLEWYGSIEAVKRKPPINIVELLSKGVEAGKLSLAELMHACIFMSVAATDSTSTTFAQIFIHFVRHPETMDHLAAHPEDIDAFINETIRLYTPLARSFKRVLKEVEIGGVKVPKDAQLIMLVGAANVDEAKYEDPFTFDMHRKGLHQHLGFGRGKHYCLGAPLALMEAKSAVKHLLKYQDHFRLNPHEEPAFVTDRDPTLYGFEKLPVIIGKENP